ncbi:hypothetical protein RvY_12591 [Ramazzottius varieornatus]|uniref:Uncharacterized protein n=1 Tax=Ramazzottius varieornatus TaxID=947166 RepID=A0A1D1VTS5_RAMVA|nr:hypothetical protein RvY_12591 [Ramazzottius varieornatus]
MNELGATKPRKIVNNTTLTILTFKLFQGFSGLREKVDSSVEALE